MPIGLSAFKNSQVRCNFNNQKERRQSHDKGEIRLDTGTDEGDPRQEEQGLGGMQLPLEFSDVWEHGHSRLEGRNCQDDGQICQAHEHSEIWKRQCAIWECSGYTDRLGYIQHHGKDTDWRRWSPWRRSRRPRKTQASTDAEAKKEKRQSALWTSSWRRSHRSDELRINRWGFVHDAWRIWRQSLALESVLLHRTPRASSMKFFQNKLKWKMEDRICPTAQIFGTILSNMCPHSNPTQNIKTA